MSNEIRQFNLLDRIILNGHRALETLFGVPRTSGRSDPAQGLGDVSLGKKQQKHVAGLMRVDHTGEVCAQALYQGQALTARLPLVREKMERAALEENDHLAWCKGRLDELGSHTSYLDPFWYTGSFVIGALAGCAGDKWSLGFVAETEQQVVKHLDRHLGELPKEDRRSRAILEQMKEDEGHHATTATEAGGAELPNEIKWLMGAASKIMTGLAYYI